MSATALPVEATFPTGTGNQTLVLLVCAGFIWAGRYADCTYRTPDEIGVTTTRRATAHRSALQLGRKRFALHPRALTRACRWLSRQGITIKEQHS